MSKNLQYLLYLNQNKIFSPHKNIINKGLVINCGGFYNLIMKYTLIFILELTFFILISVPIAVMLYMTVHFFYEIKRIIDGIRFRAERIRKLN
jgi:hypothetical protein